jgi:hypothetical protein
MKKYNYMKNKNKNKDKVKEQLENLKKSGVLDELKAQDIEVEGENLRGGKGPTVDTHWPTTSNNNFGQ